MAKVRAPELRGRRWLNTGGRTLSLADFRGSVLIVDFWTFCCVNCLHVLDELRDLEDRYADSLVVVGVHSPKFAHEADPVALESAVARYRVEHPVLDDPDLATWQQYAVRAWPTLVVVDPEGYVVATMSGEGHGHALAALVDELVAEHGRRGTLRRGSSPYVPTPALPGALRFPSHAVLLDDGSVLVADPGHHGVTWLEPDAETLRRRIGTGAAGRQDGSADDASFVEPHGLCRLPGDLADAVGYDVVVADTVNHLLRGLDTSTGEVVTVAGTGAPWRRGDTEGRGPWPALDIPLSSPWDVHWFDGRVAVAMAGTHQIWWFDPVRRTTGLLTGTTSEGIVDGEAAYAWLAQPSALAVDDATLWFVDAETSALRRLHNGVVTTVVGKGLFDFGHVDGPAGKALMQHPLGVAALADGSVVVADTYNGAVRRFDPDDGRLETLAAGLAEPTGVLLDQDGDTLLVVESAAHRIVRVPVPHVALAVTARALRTPRPTVALAPGPLHLRVPFVPPPGQKLDDRYGPAAHLVVSASPPELLVHGAGSSTQLARDLVLADPRVSGVATGTLHVSARAASCDDPGAAGAAEFPSCHVHQQDWGVPVELAADGSRDLTLPLSARG